MYDDIQYVYAAVLCAVFIHRADSLNFLHPAVQGTITTQKTLHLPHLDPIERRAHNRWGSGRKKHTVQPTNQPAAAATTSSHQLSSLCENGLSIQCLVNK